MRVCCVCRMGVSQGDGCVVSSRDLKVFGVEGLRVIDASTLPHIIGGQTAAPAVMLAERAAALLTGQAQIVRGAVKEAVLA